MSPPRRSLPPGRPFLTRLEFSPEPDGRAHLYVVGTTGFCLYDVILDADLDSPPMRMELRHLTESLDIPAWRIRNSMRVFVQAGQAKQVIFGIDPDDKPLAVLEQRHG